jgi:hypothetical protein
MFSLATLVYINEYKALSNCNQDRMFRHSSLVSSSGVILPCEQIPLGFLLGTARRSERDSAELVYKSI